MKNMVWVLFALIQNIFFGSLALSFDSPTQILTFGNSLYKEEDYYRAITEYKRFIHFYPNHSLTNKIKFQIGFSYLKGQKWDAALPYFQSLSQDLNLKEEASFALAQTDFLSKKYDYSIHEWDEFLKQFPKSKFVDAARYQKAWTYFLKEDLINAKAGLNETHSERAKSLLSELDRWDGLPHRSPFLAGLMSAALPGLGQWYDGRFWDGAAALVVNGMFGYGLYRTWKNEYYPTFGILAFIASGFYGGNIFSAVSSAHKYNKNVKESEWMRLQKKYGLNMEWNGQSLILHF